MSEFILPIIEIIIGIILLFWGGELFIQGAITLSLTLGIPQLVIGLTVVSLGTSSPELLVSLNSIFKGSDSIAASNVIGSNIFNILVVLGISSLIKPLKVSSRLIRQDVPILIAISVGVWGISSTGFLTWQAGIFLIFCLLANTIWEIHTINEKKKSTKNADSEIEGYYDSNKGKVTILFKLISGILLLSYGSNTLVIGSQNLAILLGINEIFIGLTIVATGTGLPELVTSIIAASKGKTDLAIGNVIGSNMLNLLLILGTCSIFSGLKGLTIDPNLIKVDLPFMVITTFACMATIWTKGQITRGEGFALLNLYIFYVLDKILYLNDYNFLNKARIFMVIYFGLLIIFLFAQDKFKISRKKI